MILTINGQGHNEEAELDFASLHGDLSKALDILNDQMPWLHWSGEVEES